MTLRHLEKLLLFTYTSGISNFETFSFAFDSPLVKKKKGKKNFLKTPVY